MITANRAPRRLRLGLVPGALRPSSSPGTCGVPETEAAELVLNFGRLSYGKGYRSMIREMLGIAEGILQDLHNDHSEVDSLMERITENEDGSERGTLFEEMKTKLLAHAHAEQELLYRPLEASQSEASRSFALEGTNEHQILEKQLQKLSAEGDKTSEQWAAELKVLRELVEHHVEEEETTGFSCARHDFAKEELEAMGQRFQTRKAQLMTRVAA
jgi:hemerythrin-like domain-containing protein